MCQHGGIPKGTPPTQRRKGEELWEEVTGKEAVIRMNKIKVIKKKRKGKNPRVRSTAQQREHV